MNLDSHSKFDSARAEEYAKQARIGLAGYDACHELSACILSAALSGQKNAQVLVIGAGGTAGEIITLAGLEPTWTFIAVDPSQAMLDMAKTQICEAGLEARVTFIDGDLSTLTQQAVFDAALMIGVLHHIPDDVGKAQLLRDTAARLLPGASFVLAGNYRAYTSEPLLQAAWANRWRMHGAKEQEIREKLAKIQAGATPPASEQALIELVKNAGFEKPERFFSSLFWGAWHTRLDI